MVVVVFWPNAHTHVAHLLASAVGCACFGVSYPHISFLHSSPGASLARFLLSQTILRSSFVCSLHPHPSPPSATRCPNMCDAERTVTAGPAMPDHPLLHTPVVRGRRRSTRQTSSASPLSRTGHSSSESHRPALSAKRSTTSRSSSQPSTPLDGIPETLWEHVLRPSPIPDTGNPDFSIEEITSTRLSIDDQAILESLAEDQVVTKKGVTDIWEDRGDRLKQLTKRFKDLPNGFFTLKGRRRPPASSPTSSPCPHVSEPFLQQPELTTELCIPDLADSTDSQRPDGNGLLVRVQSVHFVPLTLGAVGL